MVVLLKFGKDIPMQSRDIYKHKTQAIPSSDSDRYAASIICALWQHLGWSIENRPTTLFSTYSDQMSYLLG